MPQIEVADVKSWRATAAEADGTSELLEKDNKRRRFYHIVIAFLFVWAMGATILSVLLDMRAISATKSITQDLPIGSMIVLRKKPRTRPILVRNLTDPKSLMTGKATGSARRRVLQQSASPPPASGVSAAHTVEGAAWADYSAPVTVNGQTFDVIIDSGSATFALAASSSLGCDKYYAGDCTGRELSNNYGSGSWSGAVCTGATVSFDGIAAGSPPFGGIDQSNHFLTDCTRNDGIVSEGIVGMAYASLQTKPPFNQATLFDSVVAQNAGMANIWSLACCGWQGGTTAGTGTLVLGGVHPSLYHGSLVWTQITDQSYYCVKMISPAIDSYAYGCGSGNAIIDSGTSALVLMQSAYDSVLSPIDQALEAHPSIDTSCVKASDLTHLPCIGLELEGGVSLRIPPESYFQPSPGASGCLELLITKASSDDPLNIIGQVMMENYYTVFDKANSRVGFAPISGCPTAPGKCAPISYAPPSPSSTASSSSSSSDGQPTASTAASSCSAYTDCSSCASAPMTEGSYCGWCNGQCSPGNPQDTCSGYWAWMPDQCSCTYYGDCTSCVQDTGKLNPSNECGWCAGTCAEGDPSLQPSKCGTMGVDSAWISSQCETLGS